MLNQLAATITINGSTTTMSDSDFASMFGAFFAAMIIPILAIYILMIVAMWKVFTKAGREGWKSIIPFYNLYVLTEISGQNGWLFLLCLIPGVGTIIWDVLVALKLAPAFKKDTGFAIGLILLAPIFYMILGFGSAEYALGKPASAASAGSAKKEDSWVEGKEK